MRPLPFLSLGTALTAAAALLLMGLVFLRLRGPELPGYRIEPLPLVQTVVATGRVISTSRAQVGSEITGTVQERHVQEGDRVKPGDVLATLQADDLAAGVREAEAALQVLRGTTRPQADAMLRQAEAQQAQATRELQRRQELFARQLIAREMLEQAREASDVAEAAADRARAAARSVAAGRSEEQQMRERLAASQAQFAKTRIRAVSAGVVLTRNVEPGDLVQPGRVLFEIALDGDTEIAVPVDEKNLAVLAVGQTAICLTDAWPDRPFPATLHYISPGVDATRGTVEVRLTVTPVPDFLREDMTVSVNVETGRRESALAVPNDAMIEASGVATVMVVRDGRMAQIRVQTGLRGLAMTEITSGLAAGDLVLADAASVSSVTEGDRVRVTTEALPTPDSAADTRGELPVRFD